MKAYIVFQFIGQVFFFNNAFLDSFGIDPIFFHGCFEKLTKQLRALLGLRHMFLDRSYWRLAKKIG
jgi:hypothetical protein